MVDLLADMHVRREQYAKNPQRIKEILDEGAKKARGYAAATMDEVRSAMHL